MDLSKQNPFVIAEKQQKGNTIVKTIYQGNQVKMQFLEIQQDAYLLRVFIQSLRNKTTLKTKQTLFQQSVWFNLIPSSNNQGQFQRVVISQPLKETSNFLDIFKLNEHGKKKYFTEEGKYQLKSKIVIKLILLLIKSSNYQLYTQQAINVKIDVEEWLGQPALDVDLSINASSIAGMQFLLHPTSISHTQLRQVFQILQSSTFQKDEISQRFNYQLKIRSIAKFMLILLIQRNFSMLDLILEPSAQNEGKRYSEQQVKSLLARRQTAYKNLLSDREFQAKITKIQQHTGVNYLKFFQEVFVQQSKLDWSRVSELIVPKKKLVILRDIHKSQLTTVQQIMRRVILARSISLGQSYTKRLSQLGLARDPKSLFLALLSQVSEYAQEAICLSDLNQLLYGLNYLNLPVKDQFFSFFCGLLGQIVVGKEDSQLMAIFQYGQPLQYKNLVQLAFEAKIHSHEINRNEAKNHNPQNKTYRVNSSPEHLKVQTILNKNNEASMRGNQSGLKQGYHLSQDPEWHDYRQQVKIISQNFGSASMKLKAKNFTTRNHYTKGYQTFLNRIK